MTRVSKRQAPEPAPPAPPTKADPPVAEPTLSAWWIAAVVWILAFAGLFFVELLGFFWKAIRSAFS